MFIKQIARRVLSQVGLQSQMHRHGGYHRRGWGRLSFVECLEDRSLLAGLSFVATPDQVSYAAGATGSMALSVDLDSISTGSIQFVTGPFTSADPVEFSFVARPGAIGSVPTITSTSTNDIDGWLAILPPASNTFSAFNFDSQPLTMADPSVLVGQVDFAIPSVTTNGRFDLVASEFSLDGDDMPSQVIGTITVGVVTNDPPIASNDFYATEQGVTLTVPPLGVLANDSDPNSDALLAALGTGPSNGALTLNSNGSFVYTPNTNFSGVDSFTYRANDGEFNSNTATVTINVTAASSPGLNLVATPDQVRYDAGAIGSMALSVDLDSISTGSIQLVTGPFVSADPIEFSFVARPGASGLVPAITSTSTNEVDGWLPIFPAANNTFTAFNFDPQSLTLNDPSELVGQVNFAIPGLTTSGRFDLVASAFSLDGDDMPSQVVGTITVGVVINDPPIAVNDVYMTEQGVTLTVPPLGVLANDSDPNGDSLRAVLDTGPTNGTLAFDSNGSFTYTPNANFIGTDSFTYKASDSEFNSNTAIVNVIVLADSAPARPGELVEAESGLLSGRFAIQDDVTASGGQFVTTPDRAFASALGDDFVEFRFLVPSAGDYRLDAVVDGPDRNSDSFFVTVDGRPATGYLWAIPRGWTTDQLSNRGVADPVILSLGAGEHVVKVHLREGGARLDSLTLVDLTPSVPSLPVPGELVEAEFGLLSGRFTVQDDASASGGQFVTTPDRAFASTPGGDSVEFRFLVSSAGSYRLDAVVDGPDLNSDSFFVTVDGQPAAGYLWAIPRGWTTDQLSNRGVADPVILSLGAGEHVVKFHLREGGARLDSLTLVDLAPTVPSLPVPGELVEAESGLLSGRFAIQDDITASGRQFVTTPDPAFSSTPGDDFVEFRFLVASAGSYRLDAVVDGPDRNSDSFFVTVDGQPAAGYLWAVPRGWTTDQLSNRGVADPVILSLSAGEHVIRFHLREGGARLDSLTLVNLNPAPTSVLLALVDDVFSSYEDDEEKTS